MGKTIIVFSIFLLPVLLYGQKVDHDSRMGALINSRQWIDVREYYDEYRDSLGDFMSLLARSMTGIYSNNSAGAIEALDELTEKYNDKMQPAQSQAFNAILANLRSEKIIEVKRLSGESRAVDFNSWSDKLDFIFKVECNDVTLDAMFDTGAGETILHKNVADSIGVKYIPNSSVAMNYGAVNVVGAIVDSLRIGPFMLCEVPVYVLDQSIVPQDNDLTDDEKNRLKNVGDIQNAFDIVLGMPVIKLLEEVKISFDENKLYFPENPSHCDKRNAVIVNNNLYIKFQVNGNDFVAYTDTGNGNGGLIIYNGFYRRHGDSLPLLTDSLKVMNMLSINDVSRMEYYTPLPVDIVIDEKMIELEDVRVLNDNPGNRSVWVAEGNDMQVDGTIGSGVLKKASVVTFNFRDMWVGFE